MGWSDDQIREAERPEDWLIEIPLGGREISLPFAGKALAGEGLDEITELHFHENHRDLMGGEAGFFDDFID